MKTTHHVDPGTVLQRRVPLDTPATEWPTDLGPADETLLQAVEGWRRELLLGPGHLVIDTTTANQDDEAVVSAAWNAFTLLAEVIPQYDTGELIYSVEVAGASGGSSHYSRSNATGGHHTDGTLLPNPPDLAMLACVSAAASGGETIVIDGVGVRDAVAAAGPELLAALAEAQPFDSAPRNPGPRRPVLTEVDGRVQLHYLRRYIEQGYENLGVEVPEDLVRAMDVIDSYTSEDAHQVPFPLTRGQVLVFDNNRFVHGRRAFSEDGGVRRLQRAYGMHRPVSAP